MYIIHSKEVIQTVIAVNSEKKKKKKSPFPNLRWSGSFREDVGMDCDSRDIHNEMKRCHLERRTDLSLKFAVISALWFQTNNTCACCSAGLGSQIGVSPSNYYFLHRNITSWLSNICLSLLRLPDSGES